jgi:hypothetical protein
MAASSQPSSDPRAEFLAKWALDDNDAGDHIKEKKEDGANVHKKPTSKLVRVLRSLFSLSALSRFLFISSLAP